MKLSLESCNRIELLRRLNAFNLELLLLDLLTWFGLVAALLCYTTMGVHLCPLPREPLRLASDAAQFCQGNYQYTAFQMAMKFGRQNIARYLLCPDAQCAVRV